MKDQIEAYFDRLWPICRSITGNGLRESFSILSELIPFQLSEIPTNTNVLDWTIPEEWNIEEAFIIDPLGNRIVDVKENNLHIVNYSIPFEGIVEWDELVNHLHYKEDLPDAIPYVTSYYKRKWGFCLSYNQYKNLQKSGEYKVVIKSTLTQGSLTFGDILLKGNSQKEIMFSSYLCHPSMANNELSGPLTLAFLYRELSKRENLKYSYRFILAPETIGALAYLSENGEHLKENLLAGMVLTCCGDRAHLAIKKGREENTIANRLIIAALKNQFSTLRVDEFEPYGSDERQFCSPGFNLPVTTLYRSKYSEYKEYHTSLDNKEFICFEAMQENVTSLLKVIDDIENSQIYCRTNPYGEPNMGKRNLYEDLGVNANHSERLHLRMLLLNYCDGKHELDYLIDKFNLSKQIVEQEIEKLLSANLIKAC
jgi:aminopeptidase-like protein